MCRELDRLEDVNRDGQPRRVQDQRRKAEAGTPTCIYQLSVDVALHPAAFERGELMIV
jgi:hypothetical protein